MNNALDEKRDGLGSCTTVVVEEVAPRLTVVFSGGYPATMSLNRTNASDLCIDVGD